MSIPFDRDAVLHALRVVDLSLDTPDADNWLCSLIAECMADETGKLRLRKIGMRMSGPELKALGLRGNVVLTHEFYALLNERGRLDPLEASDAVQFTCMHGLAVLRDVGQIQGEAGRTATLIFHRSVMAAGPCDVAKACAAYVTADAAKPLPLVGCAWPQQCGCRYWVRNPHSDVRFSLT